MASRKEQKEQARAARIAQEQAAASSAQRTRRLQILGGVIAIAVIVIVVAIVLSSSGNGNRPKGTTTTLAKGSTLHQILGAVNTELAGIPQSGTTLGNPKAPVTMQYYGDLECPICQAFTLDVFPTFVQQEVKTGHVKVVYRSMCTATCGPEHSNAVNQAQFNSQQLAAYSAGQQGKFWQYAELFYHQQGKEGTLYPNQAYLTGLAKQVPGLNLAKWRADRTLPALKKQLATDNSFALKAALTGTPTLIMSGKKGTEIVNGTYLNTYAFPGPSQLAKAVTQVS